MSRRHEGPTRTLKSFLVVESSWLLVPSVTRPPSLPVPGPFLQETPTVDDPIRKTPLFTRLPYRTYYASSGSLRNRHKVLGPLSGGLTRPVLPRLSHVHARLPFLTFVPTPVRHFPDVSSDPARIPRARPDTSLRTVVNLLPLTCRHSSTTGRLSPDSLSPCLIFPRLKYTGGWSDRYRRS